VHPSIHAQLTPEKPAFMMAGSGEIVTFRQLDERSNRIARLFRARGLRAGDHVAILMENNPRLLEICWGAQRSGLIYTTINSRLTAAEVAYIVADAGARLVVTSNALAATALALPPLVPEATHRLMVDGAIEGFEAFEDAVARHPPVPIEDEVAGQDMLYSSGTTGVPKGIATPQRMERIDTVTAALALRRRLYGFDEDTVFLSPAPLYHSAPLRFNMTITQLGGTSVIMEHFDAATFLQLLSRHAVTHTLVVPTMFVRMLKLPDEVRAACDVTSLRCAIHAAAPCPIPVKQAMIDWWGPVIWEYYAGTEGNGYTVASSQEWLARKGTVGRAAGCEVRIVGEDGAEVAAGDIGTVYFAGGREFWYHNDAVKTAESRNRMGWTTLGDIGYVDAEGYLFLTDRKAFTIISGGVNIYPQEAENVLINHPEVVDVAVFGVPDDEFGEQVKAVVQPRDPAKAGPDLANELIAYCRRHLSPIKCPRSVDFEPDMPREPTGKLKKRLLRERYWQGREGRIV
jgi:long-chain acyl-CoA synthetase